MQLSISLPAPTAPDQAPASNSALAGLADDTPGSDQNPPDSFSQFLPPPAQDKAAPSPSAKPVKPTTAQEEAAAALGASLLANLTQHSSPTLPVDLVPAGGKGSSPAVASVPAGLGSESAPVPGAALAGEAGAAALAAKAKGALPSAVPAQVPAKPQTLSPPTAAQQPVIPVTAPSAATAATQTLQGLAALPSTEQAARAAAVGPGAKIAAAPPKTAGTVSASPQAASKKFLNSGDKELTDSSQPLGTAVAKVTPAMPTLTTPERPTAAQPAFAVGAPAPASQGTTDQGPAQADVTGSAKGAVEAAMTAAEMLSSGATQQSMNMQFSMGDAELNLRVEMKNGEVQATFSTSSAQLRSDLANEWQSTAAGNSQSSLHQIQPVFTSSGTGSTLSSGEYAQQQGRGGSPGSEPRFSSSFAGTSSPSSSSYSPATDAPEARAVPAAAAAGSLYLQTFA